MPAANVRRRVAQGSVAGRLSRPAAYGYHASETSIVVTQVKRAHSGMAMGPRAVVSPVRSAQRLHASAVPGWPVAPPTGIPVQPPDPSRLCLPVWNRSANLGWLKLPGGGLTACQGDRCQVIAPDTSAEDHPDFRWPHDHHPNSAASKP